MSSLTQVVFIYLSPNVLLITNGQFLDCVTTAFSERYVLVIRTALSKLMSKNDKDNREPSKTARRLNREPDARLYQVITNTESASPNPAFCSFRTS